MVAYSSLDLHRSYHWLGHAGSYSEVTVLHPECRRGDPDWNRAHRAWPITSYVTSVAGAEDLVRQYAGERLVCYGLNPRPAILTKSDGRLRSATDADIVVSQNLVLDLDLEGVVTPERLDRLKRFLTVADEYFTSLGVGRPVRAATGRGSHLLFAFPPIPAHDYPDLRERLRSFRNNFGVAVRQDLSRLEARLDNTQDLRRMVRVYGTSKPGVGVVSHFYGRERVEDGALRAHVLGLACCAQSVAPAGVSLTLGAVLPSWFTRLLDQDDRLRGLWQGVGKTLGDVSCSGYDFSLVRSLICRGYADPSELGTILSLRPGGGAGAKGLEYVARTVQNALARSTKTVASS